MEYWSTATRNRARRLRARFSTGCARLNTTIPNPYPNHNSSLNLTITRQNRITLSLLGGDVRVCPITLSLSLTLTPNTNPTLSKIIVWPWRPWKLKVAAYNARGKYRRMPDVFSMAAGNMFKQLSLRHCKVNKIFVFHICTSNILSLTMPRSCYRAL